MRNEDGEEIEFSAFEGAPGADYVEDTYQDLVMEYLQSTDA